MIIKIDGTDVTDKNLCDAKGMTIDCSNVPVPDINNIPQPEDYSSTLNFIIAKLDHFNYSVMSQTEITDYLYRFSHDTVRTNVEFYKDILKSLGVLG